MKTRIALVLVAALTALLTTAGNAATIQITIQNTTVRDGIWIMRPWIGLHDGHFQTFTVGQRAASGVQHIAEDGVSGDTTNPSLLSGPPNDCTGDASVYNDHKPCQYSIFAAYPGSSRQVTIGGPTIPGATLVATFTNVDPLDPKSRFLSYLVMIVPSNDAFFGTDSTHPIRLFDDKGRFNHGLGPIQMEIDWTAIWDAGTEVNTESSTDTAFLGQTVPGTGIHPDILPVIHAHPGFGSLILNGSNIFPGSQLNFFNNANAGGQIAEVTITELP